MPTPLFKVSVRMKDGTAKVLPLKARGKAEAEHKAKKVPGVEKVGGAATCGLAEFTSLKAANKPPEPPRRQEPAVARHPFPSRPGRGIIVVRDGNVVDDGYGRRG